MWFNKKRNILVTGAKGQLGSYLVRELTKMSFKQLSKIGQVFGIDIDDLDLTDSFAVADFFNRHIPDIAIIDYSRTHTRKRHYISQKLPCFFLPPDMFAVFRQRIVHIPGIPVNKLLIYHEPFIRIIRESSRRWSPDRRIIMYIHISDHAVALLKWFVVIDEIVLRFFTDRVDVTGKCAELCR